VISPRALVAFALCGLALSGACGEAAPPEPTCDAPPAGDPEWFVDRTAEVGIDFVHSMETELCDITDTIGGPGVCAFDADADGHVDLFFPNRAGGASALYLGDGERFVEVASAWGVDSPGDAIGCLAFDYDGDARLDLLITTTDQNRLYRNEGTRFEDVTDAAGLGEARGFSNSATAGDIDRDGDLDLFIGRLVRLETCPDACYLFPINCEAERSLLYVNQGGTFEEQGALRGLEAEEPTLAALFFDEDGDGDLDLYVGNDMGIAFEDRLYVNDGAGYFEDEAEARGYSAAGTDTMGVDVGDLDGDGTLEMVTTDFRDRPTRLYNCNGDGLPCNFESLPPESFEHTNWGIALADLDSDGDLDLLQTSGEVYDPEMEGRPTQLFVNDGGGRFDFFVPQEGAALATRGIHRGLALADLDGDLDLDAVVANNGGVPRLLYNVGTRGWSVRVELTQSLVGASVLAKSKSRELTEPFLLGGSYVSSHEPALHFGLGADCYADVTVSAGFAPSVTKRVLAGETVTFP
jgi:hypothetical protein